MRIDSSYRLETLRQKTGLGQVIRYFESGLQEGMRLTATVPGCKLGHIKTVNADHQQKPQS